MRVDLLFDARHVDASGIGVYSRQQIALMKPWADQNNLSVALFGSPEKIGGLGSGLEVVSSQAGGTMYSLKEQLGWSTALRQIKPKAFWTPHYPYPLLAAGQKTFVTVHDVLHALDARHGGPGPLRSTYARTMIPLALRGSEEVFVPSRATKNEIERLFGSHGRICIAPMRIDPAWFAPVDSNFIPEQVPSNYIVYVGNVKRHKNLLGLLEAFERIKDSFAVDLVLAGGAANVRNQDSDVYAYVERLGGRVHVTGNLRFEALRATVAGARCLVMPSHYEGVGLPPLEAMAVGTPVLASDIPSLRETCGDAARYFDPTGVEGLAGCLSAFLESPEAHASMVTKGKSRLLERELSIDPILPLTRIAESAGLI